MNHYFGRNKSKSFGKIISVMLCFAIIFISCSDKKDVLPSQPAIKKIYFYQVDPTDPALSQVNVMDLTGATPTIQQLGNQTTKGLDIRRMTLNDKDGYLYATTSSPNQVVRFKKDGTGILEVLYQSLDNPRGISVDAVTNSIYWINYSRIIKGDLIGAAPFQSLYNGVTVTDGGSDLKIDTKNQKLYFNSTYAISVGNSDGSGTPKVLYDNNNSSLSYPNAIALDVDRGYLYWTDSYGISRANLDGSGATTLLFDGNDGVYGAEGIMLDLSKGKIYWSEIYRGTNVIARGNLDGTGKREVLAENVQTSFLVGEF